MTNPASVPTPPRLRYDNSHERNAPWHRLLGMVLADLFAGRPWRVEVEQELALQSQRLDILIIERQPREAAATPALDLAGLPDGLEGLAAHNLLTYKSHHEALDVWALEELTGHYVTYRKLCSIRAAQARRGRSGPAGAAADAGAPARGDGLLPAREFRRYAVATRMPRGLFRLLPPGVCRPTAWPGVYDLALGVPPLRLIVINALAEHPRNAAWEIFAGELARSRYGLAHFQPRSPLGQLLQHHLTTAYHLEVPEMAYTVDDFMNDTYDLIVRDMATLTPEQRQSLLERMDIEDRLRGLAPVDRLRGLPPEERLRGLGPEERLRGLPPEERLRGLDPEERLRGLDPEWVKDWLKRTDH